MKTKRLIQIVVVFVLLFSLMGSSQPVFASTDHPTKTWDPMVINRNLNFWDATYIGFVSSSIFEKWHFDFAEPHDFVVTVSPLASDFVPLLTLLDAGDNQLAQGSGTLTSYQPAGSYSIQVQPESGSGFYILTIRQVATTTDPTVNTSVNPTSVNVGESALATVTLSNVPAEGYTSAEFTCTYDASVIDVSGISVGGLFGADSAVAISGPANGSFIVAIAGSNGNKATADGTAFTFDATGLQAGDSAILCTARVSTGDNVLTEITSSGTSLTVIGGAPTSTPTPAGSPEPTLTSTPEGSVTPVDTSTPVESPTPEGSTTPVDTPTPAESVTPTFTSTPVETPTETFTPTPIDSPTPTPLPDGTVTGQVTAGKQVTVSLYDAGDALVTSVDANPDGTFSLTAPAGTYTVVATASGFLSAEGSVTLTAGSTTTQPSISLLAGDIDNNDVVDQFDAMTIGINYNASDPAAADLNNDGVINVLDLELLAQNYRKTGPVAWQ